jgi:hypothetical protein
MDTHHVAITMSGPGVEARGDATVDPISSNTACKAAIKYSSEEWESQKERIKQLYLVEGRPLCSKDVPGESVTQLMEERYGFKATYVDRTVWDKLELILPTEKDNTNEE